uniref:UDP-N-acetylglucosamine diphosphorylase n=1 Tax=Coccolithus braarudii TaxID=221442 RepID=A0A7S0Q1I9_9EUKA
MTSDATNAVTYDFFVANGFFGLAESQVILFEQDMLPCMSLEGNLLLSAPGELAKAPNGNGGVYVSLQRLGILERLKAQGVTSIFQFGVDNLLCHVADPLFVGFCHERDADCGVKTVGKRDPHEKVGVLALTNGNASVVEYSEISKEMAEARDSEGRIVYGASHICVNWFSMAFLERFCGTMLDHLPLHVAKKKIPTCTPEGGAYTPDAPNGVKLELFIFDSFPLADKVVALQVPREEEFAPVKNAAGAPSDSPDTARRLVSNLCRARITAAGATVLDTYASDGILEISPLVSYGGEGLERFRGRELQLPLEITPDTP